MDPLLYTAGAALLYYLVLYAVLFSDGVGRSGTFCALMVSINRFKAEQMVDVFRTIKTMRTQRPGIVANAVSCTWSIVYYCMLICF